MLSAQKRYYKELISNLDLSLLNIVSLEISFINFRHRKQRWQR